MEVYLRVFQRASSGHPRRRIFSLSLIFSLVAVLLTPSVPAGGLELAEAGSGYRWKAKERCLLKKANRARANHGKRKLGWDKQLGYVARLHAQEMAGARSIWHDDIGSKVTRWRSLGQNVGRAGGCKSLFRVLMRSSGHRANILGSWRFMGFGTKRAGGKLYVSQIFESRRDPGNIYHYP